LSDRRRRGRGRLIAAAAALVCLAAVPAAGGTGSTAPAAWPLPNLDLANTRAATGPIDSATVRGLRRAWTFRLPGRPPPSGLMASTPVSDGSRVYVQELTSDVLAIDLATGHLLWRHRFARPSGGPNGLAMADGRVYGNTPTDAFALDAATGRLVWKRRIGSAGAPVTIAPTAATGLVVTSTTGQAPGTRGVLVALDGATGRVRWRVPTVREPWRFPREASGGGAWYPGAVDERGRLYMGTANPYPWGGSPRRPNGGAYPGPVRDTDSLLVLDLATGRRLWVDQVTPHDIRDYDFEASPVLTDVVAGGHPVSIVIGAGKAGRVIAWNRAGGHRLWERPVGRHTHDTGPLPAQMVRVCPGLFGGVETPLALAGGRLFVPVVQLCMRENAEGKTTFDQIDPLGGGGAMVALDAATGRRLWRRSFRTPLFACATAANDVVFTATYRGTVEALRAADGQPLWMRRQPAGVNACPAVIGDTLLVGAGAEPYGLHHPRPSLTAYRLSPA
jgi:outer membrane protein assembly factor BamB